MKDYISRYGEWAFIAGGAEGIGAAFSTTLAEQRMNLILVDNNLPALNFLADELEKKHNIKTIRICQDLSEERAYQACFEKVRMIDFHLIVYVPAFSPVGRFANYTEEEIDLFFSLNIKTPAHFVHLFLSRQQKEQRSGIILMSSLAGIIGPALTAPYAATKAFSLILSEALFYELRKERVDILACCAGPTSTPTYWSSKPVNQRKFIEVMLPEKVASYALKKLGKRSFCIPGWKNRIFYSILTRISRKLAGKIVSNSILKMYPEL